MNRHVDNATASTEALLSERLRTHARKAGWPENVAQSLNVRHDGGQFNVGYPKGIEDEVLTLEYGTSEVSPSPAIRQFSNRHAQQVGNLHHDALMRALLESEVL